MNTLVIQPTATAQWHLLINEAEYVCQAHLGEDLQSYLVFLLMHYVNTSELADSVLAIEYLNSFELRGRGQREQLCEVGDKCLLYSGLFPGRAERRQVRISYYVELGMTAYALLANSLAGVKAKMFEKLSGRFVSLMDVLQTTRELGTEQPALAPLQAMELWNDTGSQHALATLSRYTKATPVKVTSFFSSLPYRKLASNRAQSICYH